MSTIVAISTSPGIGGIGIIRMSGEDCFEILNKIFVPKIKRGNFCASKNLIASSMECRRYFIRESKRIFHKIWKNCG